MGSGTAKSMGPGTGELLGKRVICQGKRSGVACNANVMCCFSDTRLCIEEEENTW